MIVVLVVLPVTWRPISVDTDVDAYRRADSATARNHLVPGSPAGGVRWGWVKGAKAAGRDGESLRKSEKS